MSTQANNVPANDPALADLIAAIESSGDSAAIRFERRVFNRITDSGYTPILARIQSAHRCSSDTARALYSLSYGRYQIMGFNLWGNVIQYGGTYLDFIVNPNLQKSVFFSFLTSIHQNVTAESLEDETARNAFAIAYNGSTTYADKIQAELTK